MDEIFLSKTWISSSMGGCAGLRLHAQALCVVADVLGDGLLLYLGKRCVACTPEVVSEGQDVS